MKKKILAILGLTLALSVSLSACGGGNKTDSESETEAATEATNSSSESETEAANASGGATGNIVVVAREDGSGTREAFGEITGVIEDDVDNTTEEADIQQGTDAVIKTVSGEGAAIGYISLGSLNDTVKAVKVDGVEATDEEILAGNYKVSRPFNIAYKEDGLTDLGKDFISFILSDEGQKIVQDEGYIPVETQGAYEGDGSQSGTLTVGGSTSVSPVMEKIAEAYKTKNPDVTVEVQATGSGAGMTGAQDGSLEIGMASRELSDDEKANLTSQEIARDGIAIIVNKENGTEDLTLDQIKQIFTGEVTEWDNL